jgi:tRNA A58 N-methylase Trm61
VGFDSFVAAHQVGPTGRVVGVDMTEEMLAKSRPTTARLGFGNVEVQVLLVRADLCPVYRMIRGEWEGSKDPAFRVGME